MLAKVRDFSVSVYAEEARTREEGDFASLLGSLIVMTQ
jgi:hypothetical protein